MATPFSQIYSTCLRQITAYDLSIYDYDTRDELMFSYLTYAISKFKRVCLVDLSAIDTEQQVFLNDLTDEIIEILAQGMVVAWLKPKMLNSDNLINLLGTKDYSVHSPANLLDKITTLYDTVANNFKCSIINYSYQNNDLTLAAYSS